VVVLRQRRRGSVVTALLEAMRNVRWGIRALAAGEVGYARIHLDAARYHLGLAAGEALLTRTDHLYRRTVLVRRIVDSYAAGLMWCRWIDHVYSNPTATNDEIRACRTA
jgi:hypothetical protein